jgi:peptidoglycan hydrolase CwlO-like protein
VRFESVLKPHPLPSSGSSDAATKWVKTPEKSKMQAELQAMEAQYKGLQTLVGELLMTNQKLREEVAALRQKVAATESAIHVRKAEAYKY